MCVCVCVCVCVYVGRSVVRVGESGIHCICECRGAAAFSSEPMILNTAGYLLNELLNKQ